MVKYIFNDSSKNKATRIDLLVTVISKINKVKDDIELNELFPDSNALDENNVIETLLAKTQDQLLSHLTQEILRNISKYKTWEDLKHLIHLLGYDQDEYMVYNIIDDIPLEDENPLFRRYIVKGGEGDSEGYYVDVHQTYKHTELNVSFFIMKSSILTGKFWDENRAEKFAVFLQKFLNHYY